MTLHDVKIKVEPLQPFRMNRRRLEMPKNTMAMNHPHRMERTKCRRCDVRLACIRIVVVRNVLAFLWPEKIYGVQWAMGISWVLHEIARDGSQSRHQPHRVQRCHQHIWMMIAHCWMNTTKMNKIHKIDYACFDENEDAATNCHHKKKDTIHRLALTRNNHTNTYSTHKQNLYIARYLTITNQFTQTTAVQVKTI